MSEMQLFGASPFDAIRRTDEAAEYWSARDLMPLMGYPRWLEFQSVIERAKVAAWNQGYAVGELFRVNPEKSGGRPREDYRLTRLAAYLVAMNGDPRKVEVAAGQAYFAIRTREAETAPTRTALPSKRELALMVIEAEDRADAAEQRAAVLEPAARSWTVLAEAGGDYSLRDAAQILDRDPAISTGQNRLSRFLRELNWIDSSGQPYQAQVDAGRLTRRATGGYVATWQVRITTKGLHKLHLMLDGSGPLLLSA